MAPPSSAFVELEAAIRLRQSGKPRQDGTETAKIGHCAIYEPDLQRIRSLNLENRKTKIEQFAKEHGFKLSFYKLGLCAIFEKTYRNRQ